MQWNEIHVLVLYGKCTYKFCSTNLGKEVKCFSFSNWIFFFGKMKVAFHQLEYGLYSLECLVMVYVRVYYWILSSLLMINCPVFISTFKKGGIFSWKPTICIRNFSLVGKVRLLVRWFHMGTNVWWKTTKSRTS